MNILTSFRLALIYSSTLIVGVSGSTNGVCQTSVQDSYISKVTPPSPNAAALGKYGDVPVSYYTGIPSIEIPIYIATSGEIRIPVSLSYHAGGIRLNEEAGWTGLGWTLNAGGVVSRMISDQDDLTATYFTSTIPEMTQRTTMSTEVMASLGGSWPNKYYGANGAIYEWTNGATNLPAFDLEADIFNFNFSGRGGKFSFTRAQQIIQEKKSDLLIQYVNQGFKITDENGLQYIFNQTEMTDNGAQILPTSWYLSKIYSLKGDSIVFTYQTAPSAAFLPRLSEIYRKGCDTDAYSSTLSTTAHQVKYLTSIAYRNGRIDFEYDNQREDMQVVTAGKKVTSVKIYNANEAQPFKRFDFAYSYFNSTENYVFKRLRLDRVTEFGSDGSSLPPHEFVYEDVPVSVPNLTAKNSFSIDHWGFFNGAPNTSFVPGYVGLATWGAGYQLHTTFENLPGANRNANPLYSKVFSLKEIIYPTGGKSSFEFESNTFDDDLSNPTDMPLDIQQLELVNKEQQFTISAANTTTGAIDFTKKYGNVEMTISFRCSQNNGCATVRSSFAYGSVYFQSLGLMRDLLGTEVTCNPSGPICTTTISNIDVTNSVHPWTAYIAPSVVGFQDIIVIFRWVETVAVQPAYINQNHFLYGGGIRVNKITNYSDVGQTASIKNYEYHYAQDKDLNGTQETYSYGRRMSPPSYYRNEILTSMADGHVLRCPSFVRYGNSVSALGASAQGSIVGYDKVIEYNTNSTGSIDLGKAEYEFHNAIDSLVSYRYPNQVQSSFLNNLPVRKPGIRNLSSSLNGNTKSKTFYKSDGAIFKKVSEEFSYYSFKNRFTIYDLTSESIFSPGGGTMYLTFVYPAFRSEIIQLDSVVSKNYNPSNELQLIATSTKYFYENPLHLQPTRIVNKGSDGKAMEKISRYTLDNISNLGPNAYNAKNYLTNNHIISPVLETETTNNGTFQVVRNNYKIYSNGFALPENVETKFGTSTFDKRVEFIDYDSRGNLLSQSKTSDISSTYLWGYNNSVPIAEVANAKSNEIFFTSFEETEANSTKGDAYCGYWSKTGGYTKTLSNLTTNTVYLLTYWQKQGSEWVYKSTEVTITSPAYVYQINLTGQVDDIRFYPKAAQMTTYTYDLTKGMTSVLNPNSIAQFYEYDTFGRLKVVRDEKRNILKSYAYNYKTR